jgi:putative methionine-R-sulfoxide reductase with GAF domain
MRDVVPFDAMVVYLREDDELVPACVEGQGFQSLNGLAIPMGTGLSGWVAENGKAIVNGNPSVEAWYLTDPQRFSTLSSALAVPLISTRGITGVVSLYLKDRAGYTNEHREALLSLSEVLASSLEASTLAYAS